MSEPQHIGDLILPWPSGQAEMPTRVPSSLTIASLTRSAPHLPQVVLTDMSQEGQV